MAGATVYQLEPFPIKEEDIMTEDLSFDTSFYRNIADYVKEVDDSDLAVGYLAESLCKWNNETRELVVIKRDVENRVESIAFKEGFRETYFAGAYANFMKRLAEINKSATLTSFMEGKLDMPLHEVNSAYNDKFGDYVCTNECEFITFDEFVRTVQIDVPYYFGGVMYYHF